MATGARQTLDEAVHTKAPRAAAGSEQGPHDDLHDENLHVGRVAAGCAVGSVVIGVILGVLALVAAETSPGGNDGILRFAGFLIWFGPMMSALWCIAVRLRLLIDRM